MARHAKIMIIASALAAGCDLQGETIGPRGGVVVSEDGRFSVEVAEGALDHEVEITIEEVDCAIMTIDAVGPCYEVGPRGTAFGFPAKLTLELDGSEIAPEQLALSGERGRIWNLLADREVDLTDGTLSASSAYLSSFAVVAVEPRVQAGPDRDDDDQGEDQQ